MEVCAYVREVKSLLMLSVSALQTHRYVHRLARFHETHFGDEI